MILNLSKTMTSKDAMECLVTWAVVRSVGISVSADASN